ncbi:MAG: hypothetical protein C5B53_13525 [Candidatus Melainabacteria bacterium]|nr:MAG: hypothetical protein C5B53_13525 [Candidatus Melainabacteria bacterium]
MAALAACVFSIVPASISAIGSNVSDGATNQNAIAQNLGQLEDKLFEHSYPSEDTGERLNRLEQFVFGDKQTGSTSDRVNRLKSTLAKNETQVAPPSNPQPIQPKSEAAPASANNQTASYPKFDYTSYPRVTAIEKQLLGTTYEHDALPERIARLETKAFGKVSTSDDLGRRVDTLDQYALRHDLFRENARGPQVAMNQQYMDQTPDDSLKVAPPVNPFAPGNQMASGSAQRTTIMETSVFGRAFPNRPLEERVQRLEKKLVPYEHNLAKNNLPTRVDHLWSILSAANNLNDSPSNNSIIGANLPNQTVNPVNSQAASSSSASDQTQIAQTNGQHQSWLHRLGKFVASSQASPQSNAWDQ